MFFQITSHIAQSWKLGQCSSWHGLELQGSILMDILVLSEDAV